MNGVFFVPSVYGSNLKRLLQKLCLARHRVPKKVDMLDWWSTPVRMWQEELIVSRSISTRTMCYLLLEGCAARAEEFGKQRKEVQQWWWSGGVSMFDSENVYGK